MTRPCVLVAGILMVLAGYAQSFDVEQFDQLFRPRIKLDVKWRPDAAFTDTTGRFNDREAQAVFTFPIHSSWNVAVQVDGNAKGLKELLQNSVRVHASQLLGTARIGTRQVRLGFDPVPERTLYNASAGLLGISLTKKLHIRFWSANVNVSEEDRTLSSSVPRVSGLLGQMHVKGMKRNFFYGLGASWSDGTFLALPFFGGVAPIGDRWSLHYILPVQLALGYAPGAGSRFLFGITGDAFRSGIRIQDERANVNYAAVQAFASVRRKLDKTFTLRAEADYALWQTVRLKDFTDERSRYPVAPGFSFSLGVSILFGESVLEKITDEVLK